MKVYVASSFKSKEDYRKLKEVLEANGHEITHDWSDDDVTGLEGIDLGTYKITCAGLSLMGVYEADVFVLLARPNMAGAFVEMGFAIGASIPVVVLDAFKEGNQSNIFYHIPNGEPFQHAGSVKDLLALIAPPKPHDPYDKVVSIFNNN